MGFWIVEPNWKIRVLGIPSGIESWEDIRAKVSEIIQKKPDVYVEWRFADRLRRLEAIERRAEGKRITAESAYNKKWAANDIDRDIDLVGIKKAIMSWKESHLDSRSLYYLALLHKYRQLVNINYITESNC